MPNSPPTTAPARHSDRLRVRLRYARAELDGLAQAFTIGADFIGDDHVALVLGDNIFFSAHLTDLLASAVARPTGATVFSYRVEDPERYGVVEFGKGDRAVSVEEKPTVPKSTLR